MSVNFQKRTETLHVPNHAPEYTKTSECWFLFGAGRTHGHVCAVNVVWRQGSRVSEKNYFVF